MSNRAIGSLASGWAWPLRNTVTSEGCETGRQGLWLSGASLAAELVRKAPTRPWLLGGGLLDSASSDSTACNHPPLWLLGPSFCGRCPRVEAVGLSFVGSLHTMSSVKTPLPNSSQIAPLECGVGLTWTQMSYPFTPSNQRWEEIHI